MARAGIVLGLALSLGCGAAVTGGNRNVKLGAGAQRGGTGSASRATRDAGADTTRSCSRLGSSACGAGYECIPSRTRPGMWTCAGVGGTYCDHDSQCVTNHCTGPQYIDCHPEIGPCTNLGNRCNLGVTGDLCLTNADCAGLYECNLRKGTGIGACCGATHQACEHDADCCPGLRCHAGRTDNSGCGVGPTPVCVIGGVTYSNGASNPSSPECQYCNPRLHPTQWTHRGAYAHCNGGAAGFFCCAGSCSPLVCTAPGGGYDF
jgi:hypothetical protein